LTSEPKLKRVSTVNMPRETKRAVVCTAIKQLRTLEFFYHGGYRTVEPFALGIVLNKRDADNESLVCWQTQGFSDLHETYGWKLYRLSEMEDIAIRGEKFTGERPNYNPDDIAMDKILCCVPSISVPLAATAPEIKVQEVLVYIKHNEVMARFRFAHPLPIPQLNTAIWPEPLLVSPFSKRMRSSIWTMAPSLENQYVASQMP
jgi:hypothetical protein